MRSGSCFLWDSLSLVLLPEAKLLVQWGPRFAEITPNTGAQFTDDLAKLKPNVSTELLVLLSLSASRAEPNMGTAALLTRKTHGCSRSPASTPLDKTCIFTDF